MHSKTTGKSIKPSAVKAIVAIITLILSCPLLLSCSCSEEIGEIELERKVEIYNLSDGIYSNTHGDAFCISSSVSGTFSFYILDENNGYHFCTIPTNYTTVYCENNKHYLTVRVTIYGDKTKVESRYNDMTDLDFLNYSLNRCYDPVYELHIPEGSIVEDSKLNAS